MIMVETCKNDEPRFRVYVAHDNQNDWYSLRWNVIIERTFYNQTIMRTVAAYVYQNSAEALIRALPTDQAALKELWTNL